MIIYVNNKKYSITDGSTIADAIAQIENMPTTGIAIAVNNEVVANKLWGEVHLSDGDKLTIIKVFYGG